MKYSGGTRKPLLIALALLISLFSFMVHVPKAEAAQITGRKITLSNSAGAATGVVYAFTSAALPTTGTAIKSVGIKMCTTPSCGANPSGFTSASSTLTAQPTGIGAGSGWTVNTGTATELRMVNAANSTNPSGSVTMSWSAVTNPTATNTSFYALVTTYSDAAWSVPVDSGVVGLSTAQEITVTATVDEALTFCSGTSITGQNCGTIAGSSVSLGTLTPSTTGSGTSKLAASTNAVSGYSITINGTTLTSGGNSITALAAATASSQGSEQFGVNLRGNATPSIGTDPTGATGYSYGSGYGTVDSYKFVTADPIITTSAPTNGTTYTASYIANIAGTTEPGSYSAVFTYIATANY